MVEIIEVPMNRGMLQDFERHSLPEGYSKNLAFGIVTEAGVMSTLAREQIATGSYGQCRGLKEFVASDGNCYVIFGSSNGKLYRMDSTLTVTDVSQSGVTYTNAEWCFAQYGDWCIATNWYEVPQVLKGIAKCANFANLGGPPPKAKYIYVDNGRLMLLNTLAAEKVTNGTFTGAATGWTLGAAWAYSSNTVVKNADGTTTLSQDVSAVAGETYRVRFTISSWSVGTVTMSVGGVSGSAVGADGQYVQYITATGTGNLIFTPTNTSRFTIDNVSVEKLMPKTVTWSALEDVETYTVSLATGSDSQTIYDAEGEITGICKCRNGFLIGFENSTCFGVNTGPPWIYQFSPPINGRGALIGSMISDGNLAYFWSNNDVWQSNGSSFESIAIGNRKTFTTGTLAEFSCCIDPSKTIIYWCYGDPAYSTANAFVLAYNYTMKSWSYVDNNIASSDTARPKISMYHQSGDISKAPVLMLMWNSSSSTTLIIQTFTAAAADGSFWIETRDLGNGKDIFMVEAVRPMVRMTGSPLTKLSCVLKHKMNEWESYSQSPAAVKYVSPDGWIYVRATGRYIYADFSIDLEATPTFIIDKMLLKVAKVGEK